MRILITGANGFIGTHIVKALQQDGHQIVGCVRTIKSARKSLPGIELIPVDFTIDHSARVWRPRVEGIDVVINTVGIIRQRGGQTFSSLHTKAPIALFRASAQMGVKQVIQISALGADSSAFSEYHLSKKAADDYLASLNLSWLILMPSIVYGSGAKSMAFFKAVSSLPVVPLIDQGEQQIQPIHIDDMTHLIRRSINPKRQFRKRVELVGPTSITMKNLFEDLRLWLGLNPPRYLSIPYKYAVSLAQWGGFWGNTPLNGEAIAMLQRGNIGECKPYIDECGKLPREMKRVLLESPAVDADKWHADIYFLKPALRMSIAFVWLFTGYLSAFVFPIESSYDLLSEVGIEQRYAPLFLYGAAGMDIALGIVTAFAYRIQLTGTLQIAMIVLYTLIISIYLPDQWIHPFGPISKNLPLIVSILIMMALERE
ncbi:MAG: SDR family oxidoreductase [Candidatus Thiodiazotropha sp. DIVDIV]